MKDTWTVCNVDGCERKHCAKGLCHYHYNKKWARENNIKKSPERSVYRSMKERCYNKNSRHYHHYGGRGIKICDRWLESFDNFYADMGPRPEGTSIDRIDNNGNYEPGNCRWVDRFIQRRNQRMSTRNTSGYVGVYWNKGDKRWMARITRDGKTRFLGNFKTPEEGYDAYMKVYNQYEH